MSRLFVTGDTHRDFYRIQDFCIANQTTTDDVIIICGDSGINYHCDDRDDYLKQKLAKLPIKFLIVHGNHEERAWNIGSYECGYIKVGNTQILAWYEREYPNIIFLGDSEMKIINDKKILFLGGAYSIDKPFRLANKYKWFPSEQMSEYEMHQVLFNLNSNADFRKVDYIISHTCPLRYEPTEYFIPEIDQSTVDKRTEIFLDSVEDLMEYNTWFCGHFHCNKTIDKIRFLFEDIIELR